MIHNKVRDALIEFDENTLPPALQAGDSLLHIRGGLPRRYCPIAVSSGALCAFAI